MSLLIISYHYISAVTVSSSNTHPVSTGCLLSRHVLLGHLEPWRWVRFVIPNNWNGITTLCCVQSQKWGLKICSISVCLSIRRMPNAPIQMCSVTLLQNMSSMVNSHDIPCQRIGPASLLNISVVGSKVPSNLKTTIHETYNFWYHIKFTHRSTSLL
jgi:hypothetical protein